MFRRCSVSCLGFVFCILTLSAFGQAIVVEGVLDKTIYVTASQPFRVATIPGHSYLVLLDGKPVPAGVTNRVTTADYHEILVTRTNASTGDIASQLVRFVISSPNRNNPPDGPENGLIEWTPYPLIPSTVSEFAGATLKLMLPQDYPPDLEIPVIARVEEPSGDVRRGNGFVSASGFPSFRILRGHGSGFLPPAAPGSPVEYNAQLAGIGTYKEVNVDVATTWTTVSGTLSGAVEWPENSRIHVTGDVTIPAGTSLTIGAGSVIKLNPLRNINNRGTLTINGTLDRPVVLTATNHVVPEVFTHAWGGIVMDDRTGNRPRLVANGAIFVGGGGDSAYRSKLAPGSASHRAEQPVLVCSSNSTALLTNCAIINTAGQAANGYFADVTYDHCLIQRAITAGEYVNRTIIVNHSALIEFPEDNGVVNTTIADADYDAIYFTTGTHLIYNSLLGFCKDDATDSGSGGAGTVLVTNCWYESALHEANAWSNDSGLRDARTYDSVLMNSGQGFECGWSGANNSPLCSAGNILSIGNSVGVRFGDNYPSISAGLLGFLRVTNSFVLNNYRDVWGMQWRTDSSGWYYRSNQMDIRDNFITQPNPFHPTNSIWNPAQDGWRLAHFMATPPNASVGIGFATWTNRFAMNTIFAGIPVRLSSFTTNVVSVDYALESGPDTLQTGTLTFAPGETVKRIFPSGFNLQNYSQVRVILRNPSGGELTGSTQVDFLGSVPVPQMYAFSPGTQLDYARIREGFPVALTSQAAQTITADYAYEAPSGIISTGTVTFLPGQTLAWATAPQAAQVDGWDIVRVKLSNPSTTFVGPSTIYYVRASGSAATPPPVTWMPFGSAWKYPNVAGVQPANWRDEAFPDSSWLSGAAQLGFSSNPAENDERTLITQFANQITYYFRTTLNVDDPNAYTNVSLSLLRDDAGVVYFNSTEVFRSPNLPPFPTTITSSTLATSSVENITDSAVVSRIPLHAGANTVAVEIHQQAASSSDISFDLELKGNPIPPPPPPQRVYMGSFDGQFVFGWSDPTFVLKHAFSVTGPWTTVATTSPYVMTFNPAVTQEFFRLER